MEQITDLEPTTTQEVETLTPFEKAMWELARNTKCTRKPYTAKDYIKKYFIPDL